MIHALYRLCGKQPTTKEANHETHLPTKQTQETAHARIPRQNENQGWSWRYQFTPGQGSKTADGIITAVYARTGRFTRSSRLNTPADYQRIFRSPCRSTDAILLVIAGRNNLGRARLGLAIPGKWIKNATERNRIKRLVRESFRKNQDNLAGLDIVVTTNKNPGRPGNKDITSSLLKHWDKLIRCKKF